MKNDLDLSAYAGTLTGQTLPGVEPVTIDANGKADEWRDRYTTAGHLFPQYQHAGRLFVWNESAEYGTTDTSAGATPVYSSTDPGKTSWYGPDLTGIADGEGPDAGFLMRRRRKLLETCYPQVGSPDAWRREPPVLLISTDQSTWHKVPTSHWHLDAERAAIWITAHDLAAWRPLIDTELPTDADSKNGPTFASLLWQGTCYMMLECTIAADSCKVLTAPWQSVSGSPFVRRAAIRAEKEFVLSEVYADGVASPLGLTAAPIDTTTQGQDFANQYRDAWQDMTTHASILTAADWPLQAIGSMVGTISGRSLSLGGGSGNSGRGAQIVGAHIDPVAMSIELLTESVALKLRAKDRLRVTRQKSRGSRWRSGSNEPHADDFRDAGTVGDTGGGADF